MTQQQHQSDPTEGIAGVSKEARAASVLYIVFVAYCCFTILEASDRDLFLNRAVSLPIVGVSVSLRLFIIAAVFACISLVINFQVHLFRLRRLRQQMRAGAQDGEPCRESGTAWALDIDAGTEAGILGMLQRLLACIVMWLTLPLALATITEHVLKLHDTFLITFAKVGGILGTVLSFWLWFRYDQLLRDARKRARWRAWLAHTGKTLLALVFLLYYLTAMDVKRSSASWSYLDWDVRSPWFRLDLSHQVLVQRPDIDSGGRAWGNFKEARLEGSNLEGAVLRRANLTRARFDDALIRQADLAEVDAGFANFSEAKIEETDLTGANLEFAILSETRIISSNLQRANLYAANFEDARLKDTDLRGARGVSVEQLQKAKSVECIQVDSLLLTQWTAAEPRLLERMRPSSSIYTDSVRTFGDLRKYCELKWEWSRHTSLGVRSQPTVQ